MPNRPMLLIDSSRTPIARRLLLGLLAWNTLLIGLFFAFHLTWRGRFAPKSVGDIFAVTSEQSIVTWTSVVTMFALGVACLSMGFASRRHGWKLSGMFFLYLSMDDGAMLHERLGWLIRSGESGVYHWVVVVMPFIAIAGFLSFRQIWADTLGVRGLRVRVALAFAMWACALGFEILEKPIAASHATWRGFPTQKYTVMIEEGFELMAPALLLTCVITLLELHFRRGIGVASESMDSVARNPGDEAAAARGSKRAA